jgi:hypothetical protein
MGCRGGVEVISILLALARTLRGAWLVRPVPTIEVP